MKIKIFMILVPFILLFTSFECEQPIEPIAKYEVKVVWSYSVPDKGFSDLVMPVIENGFAYIAADSTLKCIGLKSGNIKWETFLGINGNRVLHSQKLLHSDNLLFLNHSNWIKAYDKSNGNLVWLTTIENFNEIDLSIMSQNGNSLVLGGQGEVIKISKLTGNIELRIKLEELIPAGYIQGAYNPVISDDGFIYVPTGWNSWQGLKGNMLCYNSETGKYLWGFESPHSFDIQSCAIKDSLLIFASSSTMFALNRYNGRNIWATTINDDSFWQSVTIEDETVYMGSNNQAKMYAFDLRSGKLKWKSEGTKSSIITIITVQNGRVYFCNFAYIYVLDASTGSVIWKGLPPEYEKDRSYRYSSPVAVGEGYLVCIGNKKVYCLTDP